MRGAAVLTWHACRPSADFAESPAAMLARGAEPPGTPAIGGGGRLSGFGADAGSAGSLSAGLARGAEPLGTPAVGGGGRVSGFGADAGSAGSLSAGLARGAEPLGTPRVPRNCRGWWWRSGVRVWG